MIFMTSLLTCCKTHQSVIEKSMAIARDTAAISQIAHKDSTSLNAKIDSIIIEEYTADDQGSTTPSANQLKRGHKVSSCKKRNDISQNKNGSMKKKTKIYGVNLSGTWSTTSDSLIKKMSHQATTKSDIKQKTPIQTAAGGRIIYVLVGITLLLFAGYVVWKNAVQ